MEIRVVHTTIDIEHPNSVSFDIESLVFCGNLVLGFGFEFQGHDRKGLKLNMEVTMENGALRSLTSRGKGKLIPHKFLWVPSDRFGRGAIEFCMENGPSQKSGVDSLGVRKQKKRLVSRRSKGSRFMG